MNNRDLRELKIAAAQNTREKDYWKNRFSEETTKSSFVYDHMKAVQQTHVPSMTEFAFKWEEPVFSQVMGLSKHSDPALHVVLAAVLAALLARYSGMKDITLATPIYRQSDEEQYVNTVLPLRISSVNGVTFRELLGRVKQTLVEAVEHQAYPVELLPELLNISEQGAGFPLFDVALELENLHSSEYLEHIELSIIFHFLRDAGAIRGRVIYDSLLYERSTIKRIVGHLTEFIQKVLVNPGAEISFVDIFSAEEKRQLLEDFNDTKAEYPEDKTIHQLFAEQVEKTPDHVAISGESVGLVGIFRPIDLTYRQLNEQANHLAGLLSQKGVLVKDIVGLKIDRSVEMIAGILAVLKAGGAYMPIDPEYPQERIEYMLKDSGTKLLAVANDQEVEKLRRWEGEKVFLEEISLSSYPLTLLPSYLLNPSNLAYVIYTSGTTGKPKGVMIEHRHVVRLMFNDKFMFDFSYRDTWTMFHSYCFDFSVWEMYGALLYGGKLVIIPKMAARDIGKYLEILRENQVTILNQTPSAFYNLLSLELENPRQELNIRCIIFGGEALTPSRLKIWRTKYPRVKLINMYGITETTVHVTFKEISNREFGSDDSNIGRPIPTLTTYIMDRHLKLLPVGVPGELMVGGDGVGRGYLNRQELTHEKFVENPYKRGERLYRSGDLAKRNEDGDLVYLGRIDRQVKIRGFRIETGEIEQLLLLHQDIKAAVVQVKEDGNGDKHLCAYFVSSSSTGTTLSSTGLSGYLASKLPAYMIPSFFFQLDSLPLTASGKIDTNAMPNPGAGSTGDVYTAPADETERRLAALWSETLNIPKETIGRDTNFFKIGGHSLKAAILISRIQKVFNVAISMMELFDSPWLKDLAGCINKAGAVLHFHIQPSEKKEYYPLSSAQERLYVIQQGMPPNITYNITTLVVLEGNVDRARINNTFHSLLQRHESLRTSFQVIDNDAVQRVHDNLIFEAEYHDLGARDEKQIIMNLIRPFNLSFAPLLRVALIKTIGERYVLAADTHHIISDARSKDVLVKEFIELYRGETLSNLRLQYKDYSEWQNNLVLSGQMTAQETYWLNRFKGPLPVLKLPTDFQRPQVRSFEGTYIGFEVGSAEVEKFKQLATNENVSLFMVMLTIYNVLLFKLSGQEDIIIGVPVAGRNHMDLENIIGVFINTLALRSFPRGHKSFVHFLREVRQGTLEAFDNQSYQFETLVDNILKERDPVRNPLFDVMFNFVSQGQERFVNSVPGLVFKPYDSSGFEYKEARVDLFVNVVESGDRFLFTMEYSTRLFKKETIQHFCQYFKEISTAAAADENIPLKDISLSINVKPAETRLFEDDNKDFGF